MLIREAFKTSFTKRVTKSRNGFIVWIPKDDADYLELDDNSIVRIGIKKIKNEQ